MVVDFPFPGKRVLALPSLVALGVVASAGLLFPIPAQGQFRGLGALVHSAEEPVRADIQFAMRIYPLLERKCMGCHGAMADDAGGGLDLRTAPSADARSTAGELLIVPGEPSQSLFYRAILWEGLEMPPKSSDRLTPVEVDWVRQWIASGAVWLDAEARREASQAAMRTGARNAFRRTTVSTSQGLDSQWDERFYDPEALWAYRKLEQGWLPSGVEPRAAAREVIDAAIGERIAQANLRGSPPTDRGALIRRVTMDLTGLPPTLAETEAFIADASPMAYEQLVDRLLASPQYAEQAARRWLDVVRYADTSGMSRDDPRPHAWRYRDYVVRSFASDKPFDQFVREQIAGDEYDPSDPEGAIATGFLRSGPWEHTTMASAAAIRQQFLDDVVNSIGESFLGISLRCARCHDHKFDPIPTRDYYRIAAALGSTQLAERSVALTPEELGTERVDRRSQFERRLKEASRALHVLERKRDEAQLAWLAERGRRTDPADLSRVIDRLPQDERPPRHAGLSDEEIGRWNALHHRVDYFGRMCLQWAPLAMSVYSGPDRIYRSDLPTNEAPRQMVGQIGPTRILLGGTIETPGETVTPGVLSAVRYNDRESLPTDWGEVTSAMIGRRKGLAEWVADSENPLTLRVIVNRIWQSHFSGLGLVRTPDNFGAAGDPPTHPELLDYLADWLRRRNWSLKALHREIVLSQTYQRDSEKVEAERAERIDPQNRLLSYFPPRKLDAEEVRDAMLFASGELDLASGGPSVFPEIELEVALQPVQAMGTVAPAWQPDQRRSDRHRRSLYVYRQRNRSDPWLENLNQPNSATSCAVRSQASDPTQALALLNSQFSYLRALALARRAQAGAESHRDQVRAAYRLALGVDPDRETSQFLEDAFQRGIVAHAGFHPARIEAPQSVERSLVEEMTGAEFSWIERLDAYGADFESDVHPWDVDATTRALAEICLTLFNSDEFAYVY